MRILGIETSCDETAVAVYDSKEGLLSHALYSQISTHAEYGGVVPELASRDHVVKTIHQVEQAMTISCSKPKDITGVAYTAGPGLVGALLVGATIGQSFGFAWNVPTIGVHHLEGHLLAPMLEANPPAYPFVALLVSGGHTMLVKVAQFGDYEILGESIDDAVGEAFDKTAKLLGLGYPGGAALAALAQEGNPKRFHFPRPMINRTGLEFSFSGLKTHAANHIVGRALDRQARADIACAFQEAAVETLVIKCHRALQLTGYKTLVVAGGVGANLVLRAQLQKMTEDEGSKVYFPRQEFCTDNGAMIAYAGCQRLLAGKHNHDFAIKVFPRWALDAI